MDEKMLKILEAQLALLITITETLQRIERNTAPAAPNYTYPLAVYPTFDWGSIGATVEAKDRHGAAKVQWAGQTFTRRSGTGKFGKAVWFSRYLTTDDQGAKRYARLCTFKDYDNAEPMPSDLTEALPDAPPIQPLDVQRTQDQPPAASGSQYRKAEAARRRAGETKQPEQPKPPKPPIAEPITDSPRQQFFALGAEALQLKTITPEKFNMLANAASKHGYEAALDQLRLIVT